ncbi:Crp/Fnr family transcriptional regulator [Mangrovibacter yixingensis]|uniref:Crp/Fnr family transcriptional regulator n=1 Tax=Mangrovibacter yixingensis TaxID=1529639 RepID=UPI001CFEC58E|nr:Crp/Fnr family transcriptional regulator [Mangrovibacter yixingensis]
MSIIHPSCQYATKCALGEICSVNSSRHEPLFVDSLKAAVVARRNTYIFEYKQKFKSLSVLKKGVVKLCDENSNIRGVVFPGQLLSGGDFSQGYYSYSAVCATEVEYCQLAIGRVYDLSQIIPDFTLQILKVFSRTISSKQHWEECLMVPEAKLRLAAFLKMWWQSCGIAPTGNGYVRLPLIKKELAALLGMSLSTLNRAFQLLCDERQIDLHKKFIRILPGGNLFSDISLS